MEQEIIKLSSQDMLEIENAMLRAAIAKQAGDALVEKKALLFGIKNLNEWFFDAQGGRFVRNVVPEAKRETKPEKVVEVTGEVVSNTQGGF